MNSEMGFSLRTPASDGACLRDDPRGARHWGASSRRTLHMRAIGVKRALHCVTELAAASYGLRASPRLIFFLIHINNLPMWALWGCGRRVSVVQAQRQIHRVLLATDTAAGETMRPRRATRR
jgi:hypothetical protein